MSKSAGLSARRRAQFRKFLDDFGAEESSATAGLKITWLRSLLNEDPPPQFKVLYNYSRGLDDIGPSDEEELRRQAQLVSAFTLDLRKSRLLSPPGAPAPAMPLSVFKRVLNTINVEHPRRRFRFTGERLRTGLKLTWAIGLSRLELSRLRSEWLSERVGGYLLRYRDGTHRDRDLAIPIDRDSSLCAATQIRVWLELLDHPDEGFVFPEIGMDEVRSWDEPIHPHTWGSGLGYVLRSIGLRKRYCWESIRRTFQKRSRYALGEAATIYLSGYRVPTSLAHNLRREQDWSALRNAIND